MTGDPNTNNHGVSNEVSIKSFQVVDYEDEPWIKRKSSQKIRRKCPTVMISCLGEEVEALVDTGCVASAISEDYYERLVATGKHVAALPMTRSYVIGATQKRSSPITKQVMLEVCIGGYMYEMVALVVRHLLYPVILGMDFLANNRAVINLEKGHIIVNGDEMWIDTGGEEDEEYNISAGVISGESVEEWIEQQADGAEMLDDRGKIELKELLLENKKIFMKNGEPIKEYEFRIQLTDYTPFRERNYPIPAAYRKEVAELIREMTEEGIIKRASTSYTSPIVIVKKKDGGLRICLDARRLNAVTLPYRDAPPEVEGILRGFGGCEVFSCTDFSRAYWQMKIAEEDQQYTGFMVEGICYVFRRVPFGLRNSGAALVQCIDRIIGGRLQDRVTVYVDDVVIKSKSISEHLRDLRELFGILKENNLVLNIKKSRWATRTIHFLGYEITTEGIGMKQDTIREIQQIPAPKNVRQVRRLIGTCNYYARFCPNFAMIMSPFYKLLQKGKRWKWDDSHEEAFNEIKAMFYRHCVVAHPDFSKTCILQTDSSDFGMGAVLYQEVEGREKIIAIISRVLKGPEIRYTTTEKEAGAIVWAITKLRPYLMGRHFIVRTDHKALTFLNRCHTQNDRLYRWTLYLQQFSFDVEHCKGELNYLPDLLSRKTPKGNEAYANERQFQVAAIDLGVTDAPLVDWEDLIALQEQDPDISKVKSYKEGRMSREDPDYEEMEEKQDEWKLIQGVVTRRVTRNAEIFRLWIPKSITEQLIKHVHTSMAHFGAEKITKVIQELCYWRGMARQIRKVVSQCNLCQKAKYPNKSFAGPMQSIIPLGKNDIAAVDIYGPLPKTRNGNQHIFVTIDVFSKFVQIYPIKRTNAQTCLRKLKIFFDVAGPYQRILSDHGTMFTSRQWQQTLMGLGTKPVFTSIRHPQSNPAERVMRELSRMFRTYCHEQHDRWGELIPEINRWLPSIPHDSTGITPYEAHFGRRPPHVLYALDREEVFQRPQEPSQETVRENLVKMSEVRLAKMKKTPYEFKVGQKVLVRVPRVSNPKLKTYSKFFLLYEGPYEIKAIKAPNVAELMNERGETVEQYNFYNLKAYHEGQDQN